MSRAGGRGAQVRAAVQALLDQHGVQGRWLRHEAIRDAEHAADLRGLPLACGGKTWVVKAGDRMVLLAFSAACRVDNRLARKALGSNKLRFATRAELEALTGLEPGSVPPLGQPVLPLPLLVDASLLEAPQVAFTPGLRTESVVLDVADYRRITRPDVALFTRQE